MQGAFVRVRGDMIGQRGASGPRLHGSAAFSPSFGGSGLGAGALHEIIAGECRELQDVFFRLQSVESAGRKSLAGVRGAAEGAGVLGVELVVVFSLVLKGYGVCSVWVHGW